METLEGLSDALETTDDIQSIVRTMKALSSVSIRQYERAETAIAAYARTTELGLIALLHHRRHAGLPPPRASIGETGGETGATGVVAIGSDRGLCGRYNDAIARFALSQPGDAPAALCVIGARLAARLEAEGRPAQRLLGLPGSVDGLPRLVQTIIVEIDRWTREGGIARVVLLHNRREGRVAASPRARPLLPLSMDEFSALSAAPWPGRTSPMLGEAPDRLLSWLVRQRLFGRIYGALTEALASEHASRLAAMQAAEKSLDERREELRRRYRRRRQETITNELLDIVSGFEAGSLKPRPSRFAGSRFQGGEDALFNSR